MWSLAPPSSLELARSRDGLAPRRAGRATLRNRVGGNMYTCPDCEAEINQATEICPRCGADLAQLAETALAAEPVKKRSLPRLLLIWAAVIAVIAAGLYAFE